jgi:hypothetical protein
MEWDEALVVRALVYEAVCRYGTYDVENPHEKTEERGDYCPKSDIFP